MNFTMWLIIILANRCSFPGVPLNFFNRRLINREMKIQNIGYIIAGLLVVLFITLYICYNQRKCYKNHTRQSQNSTHTIQSSNHTVRTVTGSAQPMTWNLPQGHSSKSQIQLPKYSQKPAHIPGEKEIYFLG